MRIYTTRPRSERFWEKVDQSAGPDACWPWTGCRLASGYGAFDGTTASRLAYELANEPLTGDLVACHRCDNPPCCNPAHLYAGTMLENMAGAKARGRTLGWNAHRSERTAPHPVPYRSAMHQGRSVEERFWSKVDRSGDGCWPWLGARLPSGYGSFRYDGKPAYAHRVAYTLAVGPLAPEAVICHTCDNRGCVRPDHLIAGDYKLNTAHVLERGRFIGRPTRSGSVTNLTEDDVRAIRRQCADAPYGTQRLLAKRYHVGESTISQIVKRQTWQHVP